MYHPARVGTGFRSLLAAASLLLLPLAGGAEPFPEMASPPAVAQEVVTAPAEAETASQSAVSAASEPPVAPPADATVDGGFFRRLSQGFSLHKENYLLPLTWGNTAVSSRDAELKYQFSFKQQIYDGLFFAYTQKSFWRILDQEESRPFRETNYNPELFWRLLRPAPSWGCWGGDLGIEHESNGNREPTSRSWNRVYLSPFVEYGRLRAELKLWRRLSEEKKETPEDTSGDENPDISDFYGYGELRIAYLNRWQHRAALMTRWNFATDKGAVQLDYSVPTGTRNLFVYGQFWSGYGESLIDYNRSVTRYGIGVLIRQ
ncbi:MAG TPA: phospholipase A [Desulfuromonadales bacterium]